MLVGYCTSAYTKSSSISGQNESKKSFPLPCGLGWFLLGVLQSACPSSEIKIDGDKKRIGVPFNQTAVVYFSVLIFFLP